jgi:hypothetical protein
MDEFTSACVSVCHRVLGPDKVEGIDPAWLAYVRDDNRLTEAARMTPCVARMVTSELHPPVDDAPVGRLSGRVPPLGAVLGDLGPVESDVRVLIMVTVAYGYFAMIDAEAIAALSGSALGESLASRTAEEVWPDWVADMSAGTLLAPAAGRKEIARVKNICGESLYQGLLELGLVGGRRRKVPHMGRFYAQAGMLLRVVQRDTFVPGSAAELRTAADRWPFEDMPTE